MIKFFHEQTKLTVQVDTKVVRFIDKDKVLSTFTGWRGCDEKLIKGYLDRYKPESSQEATRCLGQFIESYFGYFETLESFVKDYDAWQSEQSPDWVVIDVERTWKEHLSKKFCFIADGEQSGWYFYEID